MKVKKLLSAVLVGIMVASGAQTVMAQDYKEAPKQEQAAETIDVKESAQLSYCEFVRILVVTLVGEQPDIMDTHYAMPYMNKAEDLGLIESVPMEKWNEPISLQEQESLLQKLKEDEKKAVLEKLNQVMVSTIWINDQKLDLEGTKPFVRNGKVMVPLRKTAEALGFQVKWDNRTNTASLDDGKVKTTVQLGYDNYYKASSQAIGLTKPIQYGVTPLLVKGTVYIPAELYNLLYSNPETVRVNKGVMSIINK